MNQAQKYYLALAIPQLLIAAFSGAALIYFIPKTPGILAGLFGVGMAYALTIWPLKLIVWRNARIRTKQIDRDV